MAKKVKRKVSTGTGQTLRSSTSAPVAESPAPVSVVTPTRSPSAPVSYAARRSTAAAQAEWNPDYTYVIHDLKRIGVLAGGFIALLVVLSFFL